MRLREKLVVGHLSLVIGFDHHAGEVGTSVKKAGDPVALAWRTKHGRRMYVFASDSAEDQQVELRDRATDVPLKFTLPAQHAAMALIGKKEKAVIAKYGFCSELTRSLETLSAHA